MVRRRRQRTETVSPLRFRLRGRRGHSIARRRLIPWVENWRGLPERLPDLALANPNAPQRPFFTALHELLDRHPTLTLRQLLEEAGEQVWGLTVLFLAMLTFIPGVANMVSVATMLAGIGMMRNARYPWLPSRFLKLEVHRGRIKGLLAKLEGRLAWLARGGRIRRAPSQPLIGLLVVWSSALALLPLPLPFANVLPAAALMLFGVALLEEWPALGWYGTLITLGSTVYFALSLREILKMLREMWEWLLHILQPGLF